MTRSIAYTASVKKIVGLLALGMTLTGLTAADSVQVSIEFSERSYVPGEDILAKIVIVNFSGSDLELGSRPGWLRLIPKSLASATVHALKAPDRISPFIVPNGKEGKYPINLSEFFRFDKIGPYTIQPVISIGHRLEDIRPGYPRPFDIVTPATMHEQPFGVRVGPDLRFSQRVYTVQRLTRGRHMVFVKVSDQNTGDLIGLAALGHIVGFSREVKFQMDRLNNLHTLHQTGAQTFRHHVITPHGKLTARETHLVDASRRKPRLLKDAHGRVSVIGGRPHPQADDIPMLKLPEHVPSSLSKK